jgi:hypothetical protein
MFWVFCGDRYLGSGMSREEAIMTAWDFVAESLQTGIARNVTGILR